MHLRDRFIFDTEENILFIDFAGLRIETREQVDETRRLVREILERRGRRAYAIVNYEGTEIAPEIMDYYGESIKELYDRYSLTRSLSDIKLGDKHLNNNQSNETWRPGERPDETPTHPYDPADGPDEPVSPEPPPVPDPLPIPPDAEPQPPAPVREPETPMPAIDPPSQESPRLV